MNDMLFEFSSDDFCSKIEEGNFEYNQDLFDFRIDEVREIFNKNAPYFFYRE